MSDGTDTHLLIVDDDERIRGLLQKFLIRSGFWVSAARDAAHARRLLDGLEFDLIVMDVMMPGEDGISLTRSLRSEKISTPVLLLTAKGETEDRISGLEAGADDYVSKPFHMEEVLARIRALLRRNAGHATSEIECGPLVVDTKSARATINGKAIKLTSLEYRLLAYLVHHKGRVVSRTELVEHLYDQDFDRDSNTIEVFVGRLRKKLEVDILRTVRGLGYCLTEPDDAG